MTLTKLRIACADCGHQHWPLEQEGKQGRCTMTGRWTRCPCRQTFTAAGRPSYNICPECRELKPFDDRAYQQEPDPVDANAV